MRTAAARTCNGRNSLRQRICMSVSAILTLARVAAKTSPLWNKTLTRSACVYLQIQWG